MIQRNRWVFFIIVAMTFVVILTLNLLTPMIADDYRYAFRFDNGERVQSLWDIFPSMAAHAKALNGRLASHFLVQLFILLPPLMFSVLNACVYIVLLLGIYRLIRQGRQRWDLLLLLTVNGALFLLPPAFGQSFLWLSGSLNYLWCDAVVVWLLLPFAQWAFGERPPLSWVQQALLVAGALWMGNVSENVSAATALMMGLCILRQWLRRRKPPLWMYLATLATAMGWLLLMLAPGNRAHVGESLGNTYKLFQHYDAVLALWTRHLLWPSLVFIALFALGWNNASGDERERLWFSLGLAVCSLVATLMMTASTYLPARALTGSIILMIVACGLALCSLVNSAAQKALHQALAMGFALLMALQVFTALPSAYNRLRQAQARVDDVIEQREAGVKNVVTFGIKGLSRFDPFYELNELTDDKDYFPNVSFAKYYDVESVLVDRFE